MPKEFYSLTWYEYMCVLSGYIKREAHNWERARLIAWTTYRMQVTSGKIISVEEFRPLITDKPKEIITSDRPEVSKQELMDIAMRRSAMIPKK